MFSRCSWRDGYCARPALMAMWSVTLALATAALAGEMGLLGPWPVRKERVRASSVPGVELRSAAPVVRRVGRYVPTDDTFLLGLHKPAFWASRGGGVAAGGVGASSPSATPWALDPWSSAKALAPEPLDESHRESSTGHRTVCVRLCDGFSWPISHSTSRDRFAGGAARCSNSCEAESRLFVGVGVDARLESMHDIDGNPYTALPNAFRFQTTYDAACRCRPQPWEEASLERHRGYALAEVAWPRIVEPIRPDATLSPGHRRQPSRTSQRPRRTTGRR